MITTMTLAHMIAFYYLTVGGGIEGAAIKSVKHIVLVGFHYLLLSILITIFTGTKDYVVYGLDIIESLIV